MVPPIVNEVLESPGRPLEVGTRVSMESRFGRDFSQVRVHADAEAAASVQAVNALAYTVGHHIVFGAGLYAPRTRIGQLLLAHELTHVVQQRKAAARPSPLGIFDRHHPSEVEARRVSEVAAAGQGADRIRIGVNAPRSAPLIQRQEKAATEQAASPKEWYMLKVPPAVKQHSLTCWAAALSAWLEVLGVQKISFQDIILRYVGKSCIDTDNALPLATAREVYAEWGAEFTLFDKPATLPGDKVRQLLQTHGHLLFAQTGSSLGHVLLVYGMGFDDNRQPNPNYISVMDPILGTHRNLALSSLSFPIEVGHLSKRVRPAPCLSKTVEVQEE
jgi:hypothetical protein